MTISLPSLAYAKNALEPYISEKTIEFHHGRHHNAYVENARKLIEGTDLVNQPLEAVVERAVADPSKMALFNNAAQVWNHSFYWNCMKPGGGGAASGRIADQIAVAFGGYEKFAEQFKNAAMTQFGSGWAWLVLKDGRLEISKTGNADTPMAHGVKPLLTIDVWEHAYYLDYQNRRGDYIDAFLKHLVNWDFVNSRLV